MFTLKSFALLVSILGWGLAALRWSEFGPQAAMNAGYQFGLVLGAGGLIVAALCSATTMYALGVRHGIQLERDRG